MSANKQREAGKRAFPKAEDPKPALRLVRPSSECSTPGFALDMSREAKELLRELNQKRRIVEESDTPDAA